jgi:hypothetical protein
MAPPMRDPAAPLIPLPLWGESDGPSGWPIGPTKLGEEREREREMPSRRGAMTLVTSVPLELTRKTAPSSRRTRFPLPKKVPCQCIC